MGFFGKKQTSDPSSQPGAGPEDEQMPTPEAARPPEAMQTALPGEASPEIEGRAAKPALSPARLRRQRWAPELPGGQTLVACDTRAHPPRARRAGAVPRFRSCLLARCCP